jgi:hypothetical protein
MLKNLGLWLVLTALCIINIAVSHEMNHEGMIELADKIYIESDQINFADKKIYIQIKDSIFETSAIHSDEKGYYIDQVAKSGNCAWYEWECREETCLTCNLRGTLKCGRCGRGISE